MKKFIKESLRKHLNEDLRHNEYVKMAMNGGFDLDSAKQHLDKTLNKIKSLPQTIKLYRVVFVDNPNDINDVNIGSHYVDNKNDLTTTHSQDSHVGGGDPYILTVNAPKNIVDVDATIKNKMLYPHENEITLKNSGVGGKVINVEPFKTNDNISDIIGSAGGDFDGFDDLNF